MSGFDMNMAGIDGLPEAVAPFGAASGRKRWIVLLALAALCALAWYGYHAGKLAPAAVTAMIGRHPFGGAMIFVAIYTLSVLTALPTLPLNLAAGFFWGPVWGGLLSTAGATFGAIGAFFAARLLFGQPLARRVDNRFVAWLQQEFETKGWRFIAFLRLNPVFPTGPLNYILGLTSIDPPTYAWATFVFLLAPSSAIALIGHEMGALLNGGEALRPLRILFAAMAVVTLLIGLRYVARYLAHKRSNLS